MGKPVNTKRLKLSEQIRRAMRESGLSRYAISGLTAIDAAALCRFASGERGLSMRNLDVLADLLRLDVVARGKPRPVPKGKPGRPRKAKGRTLPKRKPGRPRKEK